MPKVSVIIPCYNSAELIADAIDSVLAQTYKDYEIIVVDDGSTDNSREVIESYGDAVKYVHQENSHISAARNHGFRVSSGKYIASLDADDIWLPEKLEKQVAVFEQHPDVGLVYCSGFIRTIGQEDRMQLSISKPYTSSRRSKVFEYLFKAGPVATSSAVVSRDIWEKVGGLDESKPLREGQDYEFFARISAFAPVYFIDEILMIYRRHGKNTSSAITRENVRRRLSIKLRARNIALQNIRRLGGKLPPSIVLFEKMPVFVQYLMLLYWRIKYDRSKKKLLGDLLRYGTRLLPIR